MKSVNLAHTDNETVQGANSLADALSAVLYDIRRFQESTTDPRELALACVELEDLFQSGLALLRGVRLRVIELNA